MEQNEELLKKQQQKDSFYKQQQQRLQQLTLKKDLKADDLIRNILEKVDTDAKITKFYHHQQQQNSNNNHLNPKSWSQKPPTNHNHPNHVTNIYDPTQSNQQQQQQLTIPQCFYMHPEIPSVYLKIWNLVKTENTDNVQEFCDREKLYRILITSKLSNDLLAKLWSFVNRFKPGELTRNEMFVMLALIGLVQQNSIDPFNDLYSLTQIPVPYFAEIAEKNEESIALKCIVDNRNDVVEQQRQQLSPTQLKKDDLLDSNEFCEFKSANFIADNNDSQALPPLDDNEFEANFESSQSDYKDFVPSFASEEKIEENHINQEDLFENIDGRFQTFCEEFGDFHSQKPIFGDEDHCKDVKEDDKNEARLKILTAIKQVMHKTFNVLTVNHDEQSVIEALGSEDGIDFAHDLQEVFLITIRIKSSMDETQKNQQFFTVFDEIFSNWNSIHNIMKKANIDVGEKFDLENEKERSTISDEKCIICMGDNWKYKSNVLFENHRYHLSCANFWINLVEPNLPKN